MNLAERLNKFDQTDIYPVITPEFCAGRSPLNVLAAVLRGGAKIIQLRDKENPERFAADFRKITSRYEALLILNDFVDLALEFNADGVHLGKTDLSIPKARKIAPQLIIGASSHNLQEALAAQKDGASYINIGPIFATKTKPGTKTFLGVKTIKKIAPHIKIPFTVMGGINKSNVGEVLDVGARHIAMITAITEAEDVEEATRDFIRMMVK